VRCPICGNPESKVLDSRPTEEGAAIRRRRECLVCNRRFTTYERAEEIPYYVVKKDGRREPFDRNKILNGLLKACEKRPVSLHTLEQLVDDIEREVRNRWDREVDTREIGELVIKRLRELDEVAYVRFASVYREFKDLHSFLDELKALLARGPATRRSTRRGGKPSPGM